MKKIAVINDLSGFGRCSLTAAIPVIAAMGVQPCPLPTAVLSAQTGFPSYFWDDYTDKMESFTKEWEKMEVFFDGIYTGFVASERQIVNIFQFLQSFRKNHTFLLVDPVMGDNGAVYDIFTQRLCELMKELAREADVITPNLTELCLLTDTDYSQLTGMDCVDSLFAKIEDMAKDFIKRGPDTVIVTGITFVDQRDGIKKMGNLAVTDTKTVRSAFPYTGGSYSGTGDLFASVIAAGYIRGDTVEQSIELAGNFIELAIGDSVREKTPSREGVNYEPYLGLLIRGGSANLRSEPYI